MFIYFIFFFVCMYTQSIIQLSEILTINYNYYTKHLTYDHIPVGG